MTTHSFTFQVIGLPAPQGSKRHVGRGIMVESSKAVQPWRQDVKYAAERSLPSDWDPSKPTAISVVFRFKRPQGHYGTGRNAGQLKASAPSHAVSAQLGDIEKLVRSTHDALIGIAFDDDRQVVDLICQKRYTVGDEPMGATISITQLS